MFAVLSLFISVAVASPLTLSLGGSTESPIPTTERFQLEEEAEGYASEGFSTPRPFPTENYSLTNPLVVIVMTLVFLMLVGGCACLLTIYALSVGCPTPRLRPSIPSQQCLLPRESEMQGSARDEEMRSESSAPLAATAAQSLSITAPMPASTLDSGGKPATWADTPLVHIPLGGGAIPKSGK